MKILTLVAALSATFATGAWGQAPPPGTYVFTSGPGVGTAPFTVSGFSTSLGGSIGGIHLPNCSGLHVHGTFNGFADPNSGGCGHGIIALFVPPPPVSGGSLPGGMPSNVAGQLALTAPWSAVAGRLNGDPMSDIAFATGFASPANANRLVLLSSFNDGTFGFPQTITLQGPVGGSDSAGDIVTAGTAGGRMEVFTGNFLQTTLTDPAQRALTSPAATSWLEDFAAYDERAADGYRRDAEKTGQQADEWRKLADDARRDAERNRQRANDSRKEGREREANDWDQEAQRDEDRAGERDAEGRRLDGWSEEASRREAAARDQARERRDAAERNREQARQAERDRAERVRQQAEEKARLAQEARNARLRREQNERDARAQELEDRVRARAVDAARQRAEAQREHQRWLDEQQSRRDARARGGFTEADAAASAARAAARKKKEEEEKTWADYVVAFFDGNADTMKDKLRDTLRDEALERTGITGKLDELGLSDGIGRLGEGIDQIKAIKKLGDSMEAELQRQPGLRSRIENRIDTLSDPTSRAPRAPLTSGSLYGREMFGTVSRMVEANQ